ASPPVRLVPEPHTFHVGTNPLDTLGRPLHDLRISVTDRCNFRCVYCMPKEVFGKDFQFLPRAEILTFEEIERLVRIFVSLGVQKIRLTGGEPLVRRDLERLVEKLAKIGDLDLTLTTNGSLLSQKARALAAAGLRRVTVSLDDVVPAREIVAMIDREMPLEPVQAGYRGEVAARYRYKDGGGEIGVISSVTQPFCADCTRARLSADGALYTCLFATEGHDL